MGSASNIGLGDGEAIVSIAECNLQETQAYELLFPTPVLISRNQAHAIQESTRHSKIDRGQPNVLHTRLNPARSSGYLLPLVE
jgi:hypothetical protein